jgi:hypothetical protein
MTDDNVEEEMVQVSPSAAGDLEAEEAGGNPEVGTALAAAAASAVESSTPVCPFANDPEAMHMLGKSPEDIFPLTNALKKLGYGDTKVILAGLPIRAVNAESKPEQLASPANVCLFLSEKPDPDNPGAEIRKWYTAYRWINVDGVESWRKPSNPVLAKLNSHCKAKDPIPEPLEVIYDIEGKNDDGLVAFFRVPLPYVDPEFVELRKKKQERRASAGAAATDPAKGEPVTKKRRKKDKGDAAAGTDKDGGPVTIRGEQSIRARVISGKTHPGQHAAKSKGSAKGSAKGGSGKGSAAGADEDEDPAAASDPILAYGEGGDAMDEGSAEDGAEGGGNGAGDEVEDLQLAPEEGATAAGAAGTGEEDEEEEGAEEDEDAAALRIKQYGKTWTGVTPSKGAATPPKPPKAVPTSAAAAAAAKPAPIPTPKPAPAA